MPGIINFIAFYIGWFACVGGAARGWLWLGPLVVGGLLTLHLIVAREPRREARLILAAGMLGWLVDTAQASADVFSFGNHSFAPWLCPPWMVALWMNFATTLNSSMGWLSGRYLLGLMIGAISGPLSYYYGERLGAIEFHHNLALSLVAIAVSWGTALPLLLRLAAVLTRKPIAVVSQCAARGE